MLNLPVHSSQIKIHFPGKLRLKRHAFQLNHDKTPKLHMIKQEINVKVFIPHDQMVIAANKGEANTEREEELLDVGQKRALQVSFFYLIMGRNKVEHIRVPQHLLGQIRLKCRQRAFEICER